MSFESLIFVFKVSRYIKNAIKEFLTISNKASILNFKMAAEKIGFLNPSKCLEFACKASNYTNL